MKSRTSRIRISKKITRVLLTAIFLFLSFYLFYMRPRRVVPILMYHAVSDEIGSTLNVTPENFSKQMDFLKKNGYSVISLDDLVKVSMESKKFLEKTIVVTFDDGFEDNYLHAFPVLARHKMPAIIFLITDYIGRREGYMNWDQVRLMLNNGIDFGGHTRSHIYLPSIEDEQRLWDEIAGCKEDIERQIGREVRYFCYPIGGFNDKTKKIVEKSGYKGACVTNRGFDRLNHDVYELNRVKITNSDMNKPFHFRAKISGYYNMFRRSKSGE